MSFPKVSVIMPVFNEESNLEESLWSFADQTIAPECELICVDDGSTDDSCNIIQSFARKSGCDVKVLRQNNQGSGRARNLGLDSARGEYVAFLDSDDLYSAPHVLDTLYGLAKGFEQDIAGGSIELLTASGRHEFTPTGPTAKYYTGQVFGQDGVMRYQDYQFEFGFYRFIYARTLVDNARIRFPDYLRFQDPPFMVQAMLASGTFYATSLPTYCYRRDGKKVLSWSYEKGRDALNGILDVARLALENNLLRLYDNCVHRLCNEIAPALASYLSQARDFEMLVQLENARDELEAIGDSMYLEHDHRFDDVLSLDRLLGLYQEVEAARVTIDGLNSKCTAAEYQVAQLEARVSALEQSTSWRAGRALTWVPRKLKQMLGRRRK